MERQEQPLKFVLIVADGAADLARHEGLSPLTAARKAYTDFVVREGVCGLMQTLYADLPRGSIVAQLGMLGWDPRLYFPHGRASCELLALDGVHLEPGDLALRANLVRMDGRRLASYNADYILSHQAIGLVKAIRSETRDRFPAFELYHNSDFRNTLVVRGAGIDPRSLIGPEPHEIEGIDVDLHRLMHGTDAKSSALADSINQYVGYVREVLSEEVANMLFPWSPSSALMLPSFADHTGFRQKAAIIGAMDFLHGIAKAGGLDFVKVGNGRPDTDYRGKGAKVIELLSQGFTFVVCHINGPDEASHMGDRELKIQCLEQIDRHVVGPVVEYFLHRPEELGGVMILPDHYTNHACQNGKSRWEAHSLDPVPFALWNGRERDQVELFGEETVYAGRYGSHPVSHLELLRILGIKEAARSLSNPR